MGVLTAQTVEKFEFPQSKMADGRHFERNRLIIISQQPFDRFWWNLARWRKLASCRGQTVKISKFWKSKMAERKEQPTNLSETKVLVYKMKCTSRSQIQTQKK